MKPASSAAQPAPGPAPCAPAFRVAVTRDEPADGELARALRARGLEPVPCPAVATAGSPEPERLRDAACNLERYDWLVVASGRGLDALVEARDGRPLPASLRCAAVGARTAARLAGHGARTPLTAERAGAAALIEALAAHGPWGGRRCLVPRALEGDGEIGAALRRMGAAVDEISAYRTVERPAAEIAEAWGPARADAVVITSPSAARALVSAIGRDALERLALRVAIGDTTRDALIRLGLDAQVAARADFESVAEMVASLVSTRRGHP
ncbi:MAG TPA: uroporphyrinogen-III synthase [Candidatus Eisenbacteria bacterium]